MAWVGVCCLGEGCGVFRGFGEGMWCLADLGKGLEFPSFGMGVVFTSFGKS